MDLFLMFQGCTMFALGVMAKRPRVGWGGVRIESRSWWVFVVAGLLLVAVGFSPEIRDAGAFVVGSLLLWGACLAAVCVRAIRSARTARARSQSEASRLEDATSASL